MTIPCKECICVPICKHKRVKYLFDDCSLVKEYEPDWAYKTMRDPYKLYQIQEMLKPTKWIYNYGHNFLHGYAYVVSEMQKVGKEYNNE